MIDSVVQHGIAGQYLEVEKSDVQIEMDNKQIIKLHYCIINNPDGSEDSFFQGICDDGSSKRLDPIFVEINFSPKYLETVKEQQTSSSKFMFLPPGAPRTDKGHYLCNPAYPEVKFRQGDRKNCLFSSSASSLWFFGF